jgi:hypothetical protein
MVGYATDTVMMAPGDSVVKVILHATTNLAEVVINDARKTTEIGLMSNIKTEIIGQQELYKAACCNLGSSFETIPSVDIAFTDAVTGYRQIKLLGLSGPYTLITQENIPETRGLTAVTGLTFTPGSWISGMQLSKGTGSVVNGFESIAGQINVELKKPDEAGEHLLVNLYQSSQGNTQTGLVWRKKVTPKIATMLLVDYTNQWLKVDLNKDGYLDLPTGSQINIMNRWTYNGNNGWMAQANIRYLYDAGTGGNWYYQPGDPQTTGFPWGYTTLTHRAEGWGKLAKVFARRAATSIGLQLNYVNNVTDAHFGQNPYAGTQNSYYANLIFQTYVGTTANTIKAGASEVLDVYNEQCIGQYFNRFENVAGVFAEFTHDFAENLNLVLGMRGDHDNIFGTFGTPRVHLRYAPFKRTVIRLSGGRAQRTANIFADNIGYFAGNRQIDVLNQQPGKPYGLDPDISWTYGANLTHKFTLAGREAVLSADYYYTWFQQQVVVDVETPQFLNFYNLSGSSYAHSFSVQWDYELIKKLNLRLAYRYNLVMCTYNGVLEEKPFTPANRAFLNIGYTTRNKWHLDYTLQWTGTERTPGVTHHHGGNSTENGPNSPSYFQMNVEADKTLSATWQLYGGIDNVTNYMQHDDIIDPTHPYARDFDASLIWGPMMGINAYAGVRYRMK